MTVIKTNQHGNSFDHILSFWARYLEPTWVWHIIFVWYIWSDTAWTTETMPNFLPVNTIDCRLPRRFSPLRTCNGSAARPSWIETSPRTHSIGRDAIHNPLVLSFGCKRCGDPCYSGKDQKLTTVEITIMSNAYIDWWVK